MSLRCCDKFASPTSNPSASFASSLMTSAINQSIETASASLESPKTPLPTQGGAIYWITTEVYRSMKRCDIT
jgi:hypothetical protein